MVTFYFTVNASFLNSNSRYITVPRGQIDYARLEEELEDDTELVIICPNGERLSGYMHSGNAGFGPFYQIRAHGFEGDPLSSLEFGQRLVVEIKRAHEEVQVRIKIDH